MAARNFLPNVIDQFHSLNRSGERLAVTEGFEDFEQFNDRRYSIFHERGGLNNHFQGVQRLGNYMLITGSFPYRTQRSDLFVVRLASRASDPGPWGSNMMRQQDPPEIDRLVRYYRIDQGLWHAGGFGLIGPIAAVPIEGSGPQSKIVFIDLQDPEQPKRIGGCDISRPDHKAGACTITSLADNRRLLAVWSDSDEPPEGQQSAPCHLDLYRSTHQNSVKRFTLIGQFFPEEDHVFNRKFQTLDFVWGGDEGAEEKLFAIGFENTSDKAPFKSKDDVAYLFETDFSQLPSGAPSSGPVQLEQSFMKQVGAPFVFEKGKTWYNMDAGSCAYIDSNQQLVVYSVYHFIERLRSGSIMGIKGAEFRATVFESPIVRLEDAWVDLYEKKDFEGRRLALLGPWDSSIANTRNIYADDEPFDRTKSIRCQLPTDVAFVLYQEKEYAGDGALVLAGTGDVEEIDIFGTGFSFKSCRLQPLSVASALPGAVVV